MEKQHSSAESEASQFPDEIEKKFSRRSEIDEELKVIVAEIGLLEIEKMEKSDELDTPRNEIEREKLANELNCIQSEMDEKIFLRDKMQKELEVIPSLIINIEASHLLKMQESMNLGAELAEIDTNIKQLIAEKQANESKLEKLIAENRGL